MTSQQVEEVLGRPSSKIEVPPPTPGDRQPAWHTRWQWGDTLSTSATSAVFPDQPPPPRVGAVWFDEQGRVIAVRGPDPESRSQIDPWALPPR